MWVCQVPHRIGDDFSRGMSNPLEFQVANVDFPFYDIGRVHSPEPGQVRTDSLETALAGDYKCHEVPRHYELSYQVHSFLGQ
jgi:hypothetical protein